MTEKDILIENIKNHLRRKGWSDRYIKSHKELIEDIIDYKKIRHEDYIVG